MVYFAGDMDSGNAYFAITSIEFESIFKENYAPLFHYVNSIVKDRDLAKDTLSDLFLNLWQQKDKLQIRELKPTVVPSEAIRDVGSVAGQNGYSLRDMVSFNLHQ